MAKSRSRSARSTPQGTGGDPLAGLERALGYRFRDRGHLELALTHSSHAPAKGDNERLEFLGDAALGLQVTERLLEEFPAATEGELTVRRGWLVSRSHLAAAATTLDLGGYLRVGPGAERVQAPRSPRVLANTLEAVLAAIYLDGGRRALAGAVERLLLAGSLSGAAEVNFKTALQERTHAAGFATPTYVTLATAGPDHARHFTVEVRYGGGRSAQGSGASKKTAEQAAAESALAEFGG